MFYGRGRVSGFGVLWPGQGFGVWGQVFFGFGGVFRVWEGEGGPWCAMLGPVARRLA